MAQSKHSFFHKGTNIQKRADIVIDLKRPGNEKIAKWTQEEKKYLKEWMSAIEEVFVQFKSEILQSLNQ